MKGDPRHPGEISMRSTSVHPERRKVQTVEHVETMEGKALEWCIRQFDPGDKPELPEARGSAGHCAQQATDMGRGISIAGSQTNIKDSYNVEFISPSSINTTPTAAAGLSQCAVLCSQQAGDDLGL